MPNSETQTAEARIAEAYKRFELCKEAEQEMREKCLEDLEFLEGGSQWTEQAKRDRAAQGRPALIVNRLDQFVQHIANAQRQNRVSARVFPVDDHADVDTAEVRQGLIRHIEYNSKADLAYDTAAFYAVAMGFGFYRILTDYADPSSFDQEIKIDRIPNPFQVYLGPHEQPDGSDAEFGFVLTRLTKDAYSRDYPDSDLADAVDWSGVGDGAPDWLDKDGCTLVEYFYKEFTPDRLFQLLDFQTGGKFTALESELTEMGLTPKKTRVLDENGRAVLRIVDQRETQKVTVKWCKLNAVEILDETEWPIPSIPLIKVIGAELNVNGKVTLKGIVRNLKDAQRQYNFMLTAQTEAAMDRGHVVAYEGQIEGHEKQWEERFKKNPAVLPVKPTSISGQPAPLPSRLQPDATIPAISEARLMAADDLKALTGIYDAALGARSNETSGRAIANRQIQTDTANFHFQDNLTRSITCSTKMILDLMPEVYSAARVIRIIGEDDTHKIVKINQDFEENGQIKRHDFSIGKYDVICTAGPSFATKRKEGAELLIQLAGQAPILMNAAPDLIMKTLDVPYSQEISERLAKTLPANLQDKKDGQPEIPPEAQQKLEQYGQMVEQLTATVHKLQDQIDSKQAELDSRERIAALQSQTQLQIAGQNLASKEDIVALQTEMAHLHELMAHQRAEADREAQQQQAAQQAAAQAEAARNQSQAIAQ